MSSYDKLKLIELLLLKVAAPIGSTRWTDKLHKLFVELCVAEIIKGNRVSTTLNKEGWTAVHKELVRQENVTYTIK